MPVAKLDFSDLGKLDIELAKLPSQLENRVFLHGHAAAARVARDRFKTPDFMFLDRTGRLRRSIRVRRRRGNVLLSYGGAGARQAHLVEYGTRRGVRARAPLRVAAYSTEDEQIQAAARRMQRDLDKIQLKL